MLIRPTALPNELDRSYLGRLIRVNGKQNQKDALDLATIWLGCSHKSRKEIPTVELLSKVAGIELKHFVCQHTTLPRVLPRFHGQLS